MSANYLSDPSRRPAGGGSLLLHSALPPAGTVVAPIKPLAPPQHFSALGSYDDGTYFEVLEHDILAAQSRLASLGAPPAGPRGNFTERELGALREISPGAAAKLALHEVLSEKLMALERAALLSSARSAKEAVQADAPSLSRLAGLLALAERLESLVAAAPDASALAEVHAHPGR